MKWFLNMSGPLIIAEVTPDDAPAIRLMGNVVSTDASALRIGMPVVFDYTKKVGSTVLLQFRPIQESLA